MSELGGGPEHPRIYTARGAPTKATAMLERKRETKGKWDVSILGEDAFENVWSDGGPDILRLNQLKRKYLAGTSNVMHQIFRIAHEK